jgi:hypothetical protein
MGVVKELKSKIQILIVKPCFVFLLLNLHMSKNSFDV